MSEYSDQNFIHFLEGSQNYNTTRLNKQRSSSRTKKKKKKKDSLLPTIPRTQNTISTYLLRHTTNKTSYQKLKKSIQTIYKISFPSNYLSMSMMLDTTTNNGTNSTNVSTQDQDQDQQYYQEPTPQDQQNLLSDSEYQSIANSIILQEYNFIAVMERFDESMVVLQMLLNGPPRPDNDTNNTDTNTDDNTINAQKNSVGQIKLGDLLYLSSKQAGSYDDGQSKNKNGDKICHKLFKSFTTKTMTNYFNYEPPPPSSSIGNNRHIHINPNYISYQERIKWDYALWKAANISLDNTINNLLGKEKFHKQLTKYKDALQEVQKHCSRKAIYPCSDTNKQQIIKSNGINGNSNSNSTADGQSPLSRNETNCLYDDAGCGYKCIHDIAKKLQLL